LRLRGFALSSRLAFTNGSALITSVPPLFPLDILLELTYTSPRMSTKEEQESIELLQGTLDLLILRTLLLGPVHGHANR